MGAPITIAILGDNRGLSNTISDSGSKLGKLGGIAGKAGKSIAKGFAVGAAGVIAGVAAFGASSLKSLARIEQINAQTANVIKSTGGAAGVTAKHVEGLTGKLENLTATEAETTQENANLLLTFTNVQNAAGKGNAIFDRSVSTFVDMQRAIPSASMTQLGKALNDPIKGVTALSKVGVSFTDQQKEQIKTLVESGDTMKAQKIILGELNKEFGGSGEAFAGTTTGKIELAKHAFGTLGETIFANLLPPLGKLASAATVGLAWLDTKGPAIRGFAEDMAIKLLPAVRAVQDFLVAAAPKVQAFGVQLLALGGWIATNVVPPAIQLGTTLFQIGQSIVSNLLPPLLSAGSYIVSTFGPILKTIATIVITQVVPAVRDFGRFLATTVIPMVAKVATQVGKNLKPVFDAIAGVLRTKVLPAVQAAMAKFREWQPTIQKVIAVVLTITGKVLVFASKILGAVLPPVIKFAGFLTGTLFKAIGLVIGVLVDIGGKVIETGKKFVDGVKDVAKFATGIKDKVQEAIRFVTGIPGKVKTAVGDLGGLLLDSGKAIIQGLLDGIEAMISKVTDKLKSVTDLIPDWKGPMERDRVLLKPSGRAIMQGLIDGFTEGTAGVKDTLGKVTDLIQKSIDFKDAKKERKREASILSSLRKQYDQLRRNGRAQDENNRKLDKAKEKLKEIVDYAGNVKKAAIDYAKITTAGVLDEDGRTTAGSITQGLTERLAAIRAFTEKIEKLRKAGLNKASLDQLIAEGVEGGMATAQALVAGGSSAIAEVNTLSAQIAKAADQLGQTGANAMYDGGVKAAQQLVAGLQSQQDRLDKIAERLGRRLAAAVQKALAGIVDPDAGDDKGKKPKKKPKPRPRLAVADTTGRRPQLSEAARYAYAGSAGAGAGGTIRVKLTAEQLSQLERGKAIQLDLDEYHSAGGKPKA